MTQQEIRQLLENDRELWEKIDRSVSELCCSGAKRAEFLQLAEQDDAVCRLLKDRDAFGPDTAEAARLRA